MRRIALASWLDFELVDFDAVFAARVRGARCLVLALALVPLIVVAFLLVAAKLRMLPSAA
jgi:hypothetical protein